MGLEEWWSCSCDFGETHLDLVDMGFLLRTADLDGELAKAGATLMKSRANYTLLLVLSDPPGAVVARLIFHACPTGQSKSNFEKSDMLTAWIDLERRKSTRKED